MKNSFIKLCLLFVGIISFSSCLKDNDGYGNDYPSNIALMTFVNAFPEATGLNFDLNGNQPPFGLEYKKVLMPYNGVYPGKRQLEIFSINQNKTFIDTLINVEAGKGYTAFVFGTQKSPKFAMTQDTVIKDFDAEKSAFRFLNFGNNTSAISIFIEGEEDPIFSNRSMDSGTSAVQNQRFTAHTSGTYTLVAKDSEGTILVKRENFNFEKGRYYTIMLSGTKDHAQTPLYLGVVQH
ncbi:DUF4397 domain-containing protein [Sphingobacterium wenxiniae]|uniref:DUF4397 domain-containing protein n=1 Tax=Sphingobacterium wenxiniae TaxID=683125 RepID=A0A1I6SZY5_9SPHI|nr:DUF4397 domain-containing protein [Sphingobacterium wenxiniae]SFS82327.1 protein of unknown function [Sphingobacterium wenxiniae]